jgi:1,4-dihydroxy-2-naphthoyl-CoA hydrolase
MIIHKTTINFFDCDPAGILFYGRFFEICHVAYESMISSFALKEDYWNNSEYVVPITHSEAKYIKPVKYGESISIELTVNQIKNSSFELGYLVKNEKGDVCAEVKTVHVFVDKRTWKKKEMTTNIKAGLNKHI